MMERLVLRGSRLAVTSHSSRVRCGRLRHGFNRSIATPTSSDAANLPLAGIKVLDMTRVLAGVSIERKMYLYARLT